MTRLKVAAAAYVFAAGLLTGTPGQFTPVDLSAVGANAYGGIVSMAQKERPTVYFAVFALSAGRAEDVVLASSQSQIQPVDLANLAQATANRLDAGLTG
jgi:hypothetical protein